MGILNRLLNKNDPGIKAYRLHAAANRLSDSGKVRESEIQYKEAMKLYREAEAAGCSDAKILTGYAILLMREGDFAKAKEIVVSIFKDKSLSDDDRYHLRINHAVCQWHLGYLDKALEDMNKAAEYAKIGLFYNVMGALKVQEGREKGDFTEAEAFMAEALDYDEDDLAAQDNLGWLRYYSGDRNAARKAFKKAVTKNGHYSPALAGLALMEHEDGDDAAAKEHLETALSVHFPTTSPITRQWAEELLAQLKG